MKTGNILVAERIDETINTWFLKYVGTISSAFSTLPWQKKKRKKNPQRKEFFEAGRVWLYKLLQDAITEFSEME